MGGQDASLLFAENLFHTVLGELPIQLSFGGFKSSHVSMQQLHGCMRNISVS